jgi:hypothetical protein
MFIIQLLSQMSMQPCFMDVFQNARNDEKDDPYEKNKFPCGPVTQAYYGSVQQTGDLANCPTSGDNAKCPANGGRIVAGQRRCDLSR